MAVNVKEMARSLSLARKGREEHRFWEDFDQVIKDRKLEEFSVRALFEAFVDGGREAISSWSPRSGGGQSGVTMAQLRESDAVGTDDFHNITGQIVYNRVLEAWNNPEFIADRLCATIPTDFSGEKIAGVGALGDDAESINERDPYPMVGLGEQWVETPETTKRGFIVGLTKEAIFFDRTGQLLMMAGQATEKLRINKEKRVLDTVLGIDSSYKRNGATTAIATYGDNSGSHDWDNLAASNALVDWTDIENDLLLFDGMTDPTNGEPIMVTPRQIVVPTALAMTARRILNATEIRFGDGASSTTQTISSNPVAGIAEILTSAYVKNRTGSASTWFLGDFQKAFAYMENWPITSVQAPTNSEAEFTQDIVMRWKVSERGTAAVIEPRAVVKNTA